MWIVYQADESPKMSRFFSMYFSWKSLDISCESSAKQTIHMKCQDLFSTFCPNWKGGLLYEERVCSFWYTFMGDNCVKIVLSSPFEKWFTLYGSKLFPYGEDPFSEWTWPELNQTGSNKKYGKHLPCVVPSSNAYTRQHGHILWLVERNDRMASQVSGCVCVPAHVRTCVCVCVCDLYVSILWALMVAGKTIFLKSSP